MTIKKYDNKAKTLRAKTNDFIFELGTPSIERVQGPPSDAYELLGELSAAIRLCPYGWQVGYVQLADWFLNCKNTSTVQFQLLRADTK